MITLTLIVKTEEPSRAPPPSPLYETEIPQKNPQMLLLDGVRRHGGLNHRRGEGSRGVERESDREVIRREDESREQQRTLYEETWRERERERESTRVCGNGECR
uniref:Uncharacterized protein n=1 Tax=Opuntia streptacantha TaxID=393608 RepID=A0A7C8ZMX4_OPUST